MCFRVVALLLVLTLGLGCTNVTKAGSPETEREDPTKAILLRRAPRCSSKNFPEYHAFLKRTLRPWFEENKQEADRVIATVAPGEVLGSKGRLRGNLLAARALVHISNEYLAAAFECPLQEPTELRRPFDFATFRTSYSAREKSVAFVHACIDGSEHGSSERHECILLQKKLDTWFASENALIENWQRDCGSDFVHCRAVPSGGHGELLARHAPRCENPTLDSFNHYFSEVLYRWFEENEGEARDLVDALVSRETEATRQNLGDHLIATRALLHVVREWIDAGLACNPPEFVSDPSSRRKVDATLYFRTWEDRERAGALVKACLEVAAPSSPEREECLRYEAELNELAAREKRNSAGSTAK